MNDAALKLLLERFPAKMLATGNVRTCPVRISHPFVFQKAPPMDKGKEPKYMVTLIFPKVADTSLLDQVLEETAANEFGATWQSKGVIFPWRDGAEAKVATRAGYGAGVQWFRATSEQRADVVDRFGQRIEDAPILYPGCWALVTLRAFKSTHGGVNRVNFGLQNIMKLVDDEKLGGGSTPAAAEFEPVTDMDDIDALMAGDAADTSEADELAKLMG